MTTGKSKGRLSLSAGTSGARGRVKIAHCARRHGTAQRSTYFIVKIFYQKGFYESAKTVSEQCQ